MPREARISKNIYIFDIYILKQSGRQMDEWTGRLQHTARSAAKKYNKAVVISCENTQKYIKLMRIRIFSARCARQRLRGNCETTHWLSHYGGKLQMNSAEKHIYFSKNIYILPREARRKKNIYIFGIYILKVNFILCRRAPVFPHSIHQI